MYRTLVAACALTLVSSSMAFAQAPPPETEVGIGQLALTTVPAKGPAKLTVTSPAFTQMGDIPSRTPSTEATPFPGCRGRPDRRALEPTP